MEPDALPAINQALARGNDVEIKRTPDGVKILEKSVKMLLKKPNHPSGKGAG